MFKALQAVSLMIKLKKCKFVQKELQFLRYIISVKEIKTDPEKIAKMITLLLSTNLKKLRSRLGLFTYYQQYIKGFLNITRPMYKLTREKNSKPMPFEWTLARQKAFEVIKAKLIMILVVAYLNFNKLFILYINISGGVVEAVLH